MSRVSLLALTLLASGLAGCTPLTSRSAERATLEAMITGLERERFKAVVDGDTARLRQYLAADMSYTHSNGVTETREQFLAKLGAGELDYVSIEPTELRVRVIGQVALVEGRARLAVGNDNFTLRFMDVWAHRDGQWQMIAWQSTRLP